MREDVASWNAAGKQTFTRSYTYDELNRIAGMTGTGGTCTSLNWTYDIWANRLTQTGGAGCAAHTPTVTTLNRIAELGYDLVGNVTNDAATSATYTFDAENRMKTSNSTLGNASYVYDADGRRVQKTVGSTTTDFIYDMSGGAITEKQGSTWTKAYVYSAGGLLAQYDNTVMPNTTYFAHRDHLGSTRLLTRHDALSNPNPVVECDGYQPFGEQDNSVCTPNPGATTTTHKFSGKERDSESGLDFFGARYYGFGSGRFVSADPVLMTVYRVADPQQVNLYAYARNNPLLFIDPTGEIIEFASKHAQQEFEEYEKELAKDPEKNKKLLAAIQQLKNSEVTYVINIGATAGEGSTTTDGSKVFVTISNIGNGREQFSLKSRFAHEIEHARQFDSGEWGFVKNSQGKWIPSPSTYDIYDEVGAWSAQLSVASPADFFRRAGDGVGRPTTLRLFADARTEDEKAGVLARSYDGYSRVRKSRADNEVSAGSGLTPGQLVRTDKAFFRVKSVRP